MEQGPQNHRTSDKNTIKSLKNRKLFPKKRRMTSEMASLLNSRWQIRTTSKSIQPQRRYKRFNSNDFNGVRE